MPSHTAYSNALSYRSRCCAYVGFIALLALMMLMVLSTAIFWAMPCILFILFTLLTIAIYNCCARRPIPLTTLFRALLASSYHLVISPHTTTTTTTTTNHQRSSIWTVDEIRAALIRRELVDVETVALGTQEEEQKQTIQTIPPRQQQQRRRLGSNLLDNRTVPARTWLETQDGHLLYLFAAPLVSVPSTTMTTAGGIPPPGAPTADVTSVAAQATPTVTAILGEPDADEGEASPESLLPPPNDSESNSISEITGDHEDMGAAATAAQDDADVHVQATTTATATPRNISSNSGEGDDNEASLSTSPSAPTSVDLDYSSSGLDNNGGNDDGVNHEEHHVHESTCDICLISYQRGDIVAWSRNLDCPHYFHEDCIIDWLRRKPTCCSCRRDYVVIAPAQETVKLQLPDGTDENV
jgi:hypothetical protein